MYFAATSVFGTSSEARRRSWISAMSARESGRPFARVREDVAKLCVGALKADVTRNSRWRVACRGTGNLFRGGIGLAN